MVFHRLSGSRLSYKGEGRVSSSIRTSTVNPSTQSSPFTKGEADQLMHKLSSLRKLILGSFILCGERD